MLRKKSATPALGFLSLGGHSSRSPGKPSADHSARGDSYPAVSTPAAWLLSYPKARLASSPARATTGALMEPTSWLRSPKAAKYPCSRLKRERDVLLNCSPKVGLRNQF